MTRNDKPKNEPKELVMLPEGRLVNNALFERDQFDAQSKPKYQVEVAIPKTDKAFDEIINKLYEAAEAEGLPQSEKFTIDGGRVPCGVLDGDAMAKRREAEGKPGDAYKGCWVIRASTLYNHEGREAEGGASVVNEYGEKVTLHDAGQVYNGCYGITAVRIGTYKDDGRGGTGQMATKMFLAGFQKSNDGEKLASGQDVAAAFKPLKARDGAAPAGEGGRRRR